MAVRLHWLGAEARLIPLRLGGPDAHSSHVPKFLAQAVAYARASEHRLTNATTEKAPKRVLKPESVDYWLRYAHRRIDWDAEDAEDTSFVPRAPRIEFTPQRPRAQALMKPEPVL